MIAIHVTAKTVNCRTHLFTYVLAIRATNIINRHIK